MGNPERRGELPLLALAFAFSCVLFAEVSLTNLSYNTPTPLWTLGVLGLCMAASYAVLLVKAPAHDPLILPVVWVLSGLGLAMVTRLAPPFAARQAAWLVVATAAMLAASLAPSHLRWLRRYRYTWLIAGLLVLASTLLFGVNPSGAGARLWLSLGDVIYFQPSEILKLLFIIFMASYLDSRSHILVRARKRIGPLHLPHPGYFGPMLLMWGFSILLLAWQNDLGAGLLFLGTFLTMLYAVTGQGRYVWSGLVLLVLSGFIGYHLSDHVALRIDIWLNPWPEASERAFQIVQSLLAFASGGIFGQGLNMGLPTAIPVVHTDFVFAAVGEEMGFLGVLAVVGCFVILVGRALYVSLVADSTFKQLLALGIGSMLAVQSLIIMGGTLKLIPLTGITLPFVSYGGSSLLSCFIMVGLLLNISAGGSMERWSEGQNLRER